MVIEAWRRHYNTIRPHSALGYHPLAPETEPWTPAPASSWGSPAATSSMVPENRMK